MATAESPMGDTKKAVESAKAVSGFAKNLKKFLQTVKAIRMLATSATGVGALANLALLLKSQWQKIRKALAAAAALLALYLLWLAAKILGIIVGALFGAVSGLPLLLVPGVGPFLYAGWVGYWAYKGWTDPGAVFHIATHPWELITRPIGWAWDKVSNFGGWSKGGVESAAGQVGSATGGLISGSLNFITGIGSAVVGTTVGIVTGAISTTASIVGSIWGGLTGSATAAAGQLAAAAVITTTTMGVVGSLMIDNQEAASLYTNSLDPIEQLGGPAQNELFSINKTANPNQIPKPDVLEQISVTFTVSVQALQNLTSVQMTDQTTTTDPTPGGFTVTNNCQPPQIPSTLNAGPASCTVTITVNTNQDYGSSITNTATLTATGPDGTSKTESATAVVNVGSPSGGDCNFQFVTGPAVSGLTPAAWTQAEIDTVNSICSTIFGRSPTVMGLLNNAGTITLQRYAGTCGGFVNGGTVVNLTGSCVANFDSAKYLVIHELGHVIGNKNNSIYTAFQSSGAYATEGDIKTYPICPGNENENFAEMIADYTVAKTYAFSARCTGYPGGPYTTFQSDYPTHFNFARDNIFGGVLY